MIIIENLTKRFGRATAVDHASLSVQAGESLALWGANGAGKTTLIRCALGLLDFKGTITIGGIDVRRRGKHARLLVGYVPQELGFYDDLGVAEAVGLFARLKGLGKVDPALSLARVGLARDGGKRIRELSGGMKQRLALAIALLGDPPVLVLDEVTASLDAVGRGEFVGLLKRLSGEGRTMLFASHRLEEVANLAARVARLERGRIVSVDPCRDFILREGESLAQGVVLRLMLAPALRERALDSLQRSGFLPKLNGVGVLVPVSPEHKAAPFRVLAEASITIDDFELVTAAQAAQLASHVETHA